MKNSLKGFHNFLGNGLEMCLAIDDPPEYAELYLESNTQMWIGVENPLEL
ncbi:MAG: hypothetical protein K2H31_08270 [Lachnospiraceae bacterium]|nr:hypothetical protein [Lachnospiraceae bacterium]